MPIEDLKGGMGPITASEKLIKKTTLVSSFSERYKVSYLGTNIDAPKMSSSVILHVHTTLTRWSMNTISFESLNIEILCSIRTQDL